ncbi:DNA-3-methyladenine glycosylase family protein [Paractinoplanes globisporus]|uniref:DNA-3-methyladenine glycosylase II n=1 Tax=Paractinoplanes globisporus TaxID=113565 RepID=A0ABW6W9P5_9ACTN|nr:DNA-3-methyladenine glycosylase [Actinoplanes globisporus]
MARSDSYPDGTPLDAADRHLAAADPAMRGLIARWGPVAEVELPEASREHFGSLILAIVSQQFSTRAARAMFDRIMGQYSGRLPTPAELLATDLDELRVAAGLSHAKARAIRSLAEHIESGALDLDGLPGLPDDEVRRQLVAVDGIGDWTAGVFLLFTLHRPDVLLANDLGIRKGVRDAYGLGGLPDATTVTRLAEPWRPHRTRACLYLWRSLETAPVPVSS